jgi:hypothetical protein
MKISKYQQRNREQLVKKTITLYKQGFSYRQMEPIIGKSRQWISTVIREFHPEAFVDNVDK